MLHLAPCILECLLDLLLALGLGKDYPMSWNDPRRLYVGWGSGSFLVCWAVERQWMVTLMHRLEIPNGGFPGPGKVIVVY